MVGGPGVVGIMYGRMSREQEMHVFVLVSSDGTIQEAGCFPTGFSHFFMPFFFFFGIL